MYKYRKFISFIIIFCILTILFVPIVNAAFFIPALVPGAKAAVASAIIALGYVFSTDKELQDAVAHVVNNATESVIGFFNNASTTNTAVPLFEVAPSILNSLGSLRTVSGSINISDSFINTTAGINSIVNASVGRNVNWNYGSNPTSQALNLIKFLRGETNDAGVYLGPNPKLYIIEGTDHSGSMNLTLTVIGDIVSMGNNPDGFFSISYKSHTDDRGAYCYNYNGWLSNSILLVDCQGSSALNFFPGLAGHTYEKVFNGVAPAKETFKATQIYSFPLSAFYSQSATYSYEIDVPARGRGISQEDIESRKVGIPIPPFAKDFDVTNGTIDGSGLHELTPDDLTYVFPDGTIVTDPEIVIPENPSIPIELPDAGVVVGEFVTPAVTSITASISVPVLESTMNLLSDFGSRTDYPAPVIRFPIGNILKATSPITGIGNKQVFSDNNPIVIDFSVMEDYSFMGMTLIEIFRLLVSFGMLSTTFYYVWRKIYPDKMLS